MDKRAHFAEQLRRVQAFYSFVSPIFSTDSIEEGSYRMLLYSGVCANVLECYAAILTLLENGENFVGAFALLQPLRNTALQAVWLRLCGPRPAHTTAPRISLPLPSGAECAAAIKQFPGGEAPGADFPALLMLLGAELRWLSDVISPEMELAQHSFHRRVLSGLECPPKAMEVFLQQASEPVAILAIMLVNVVLGGEPSPIAREVATKYHELFGEDVQPVVAAT